MLKFGELYRKGGVWNGQRILSQSWVDESLAKHTVLEGGGNEYGYLFWHETYRVGDREFAALEASGAGGQFICIVSELDLVIVITSGNYRSGNRDQPGEIIERYLLPCFMD
jgi:CubicO group peptidase (beta-lactamase class C family)